MIQRVTLTIIMISLAGCANFPSYSGKSKESATVTSYGVSKTARFESEQHTDRVKLLAPHNQTYYYAFDSDKVQQIDLQSIAAQANYIKSHPSSQIRLEGHTDEQGSREYNVGLSERRAKSILDLLRSYGVSRQQIRVVSYGMEKLAIDNARTDDEHSQNRRVELVYEAL